MDKVDLLSIQDRLATWSVPFTCQHSSSGVIFLLDSSVINLPLEFKSNFVYYAIQIMERNVRLAVTCQ